MLIPTAIHEVSRHGGAAMITRTAIIATPNVREVAQYLPRNYSAAPCEAPHGFPLGGQCVRVTGHDHAGWTLDGYVLPRLASGLLFGREV